MQFCIGQYCRYLPIQITRYTPLCSIGIQKDVQRTHSSIQCRYCRYQLQQYFCISLLIYISLAFFVLVMSQLFCYYKQIVRYTRSNNTCEMGIGTAKCRILMCQGLDLGYLCDIHIHDKTHQNIFAPITQQQFLGGGVRHTFFIIFHDEFPCFRRKIE